MAKHTSVVDLVLIVLAAPTGSVATLRPPLQLPNFWTTFLIVKGREVLIVGMNDGEVINEKVSPQKHVTVSKGLVMLMRAIPVEQFTRLRVRFRFVLSLFRLHLPNFGRIRI